MDTTNYSEGQFVTPLLVTQSPTKVGVVLSEARPEQTRFGEQLTTEVSIDAKIKSWNLNRDSVKNMQKLGVDSNLWVGKKVRFTVVTVSGKESVIGDPVTD